MVTLTLDNHSDADRYDIKESFEALDRQKTGRLQIGLAYALLLGLGYITDYKKKDEFNPATLEEAAKQIESVESENNYNGVVDLSSGITLETLLTVVATHPALSQGYGSESFATRCFELMDRDQKGYIAASDVEHLGRDVEKIERKWNERQKQNGANISTDEANEMIETTNKIFTADTTCTRRIDIENENENENENEHRLQPSIFGKVFAPSFH